MTTFILDGIWGWHARWEPLRRRLEEHAGSSARIWHYDNSGRVSLETLGATLARELSELQAPFHLVGYSMGGIVVREALRQMPGLPLQKAALLHSPHSGTLTGHLLPLPACREMRPGSAFLRRLAESPWDYPTLVSWTPGDLMILPGRSACWSRASQMFESKVPAHAWPVMSREIHQKVADFLHG